MNMWENTKIKIRKTLAILGVIAAISVTGEIIADNKEAKFKSLPKDAQEIVIEMKNSKMDKIDVQIIINALSDIYSSIQTVDKILFEIDTKKNKISRTNYEHEKAIISLVETAEKELESMKKALYKLQYPTLEILKKQIVEITNAVNYQEEQLALRKVEIIKK